MTTETAPFRPIVASSQPANDTPTYGSTHLRHPARVPLRIPQTITETTGPRFTPAQFGPMPDLSVTNGRQAQGERIIVRGRVVDENNRPVPHTMIEIWQANAAGRYSHPNDENTAALDEKFHGFAVTRTDDEGRYRFKTVRPAAYPAAPGRWRPAHIHFSVTSKYEQLVTQMYFRGGEYNDTDPWLNSASRKDLLITDPTPVSGKEAGAQQVTFDIVLTRG